MDCEGCLGNGLLFAFKGFLLMTMGMGWRYCGEIEDDLEMIWRWIGDVN